MEHPLRRYFYTLPKENIRATPLMNRDESRLFVYDTKRDTIVFDHFYNIAKYIPKGALLVTNNTGVIPARVVFTKDTGGAIEGLVLLNEGFDADGAVPVIVGKRIYPGRRLSIGPSHWFTITRQDEQKFYLKPEFAKEFLSELLLAHGTTPIPYYLGKSELSENDLRERYQTIFAKDKKSVAAPTASLHITERVLASLEKEGIKRAEVTLDVGLGTFQEVETRNVEEKFLHTEHFMIPEASRESIREAKNTAQPIIAVGTTTVRALESAHAQILDTAKGDLVGETNIFIMPPYEFRMVDHLITNFHVPESSLMALVDAFLEHKQAKRRILDLYNIAEREGFKFYSFGDSMLIL